MNACIFLEDKSKPVYSVLEWNEEKTHCLLVRENMRWKRGKLFQLNYNPNIPSDVSLRPHVWVKAERLSFFDLNTAIEEQIKRWC